MSERLRIDRLHDGPFRALNALLREVRRSTRQAGLDRAVAELLCLRVSQLNGCGACIRVHTDFALRAGVPQDRLDLLAGWREEQAFSAQERAALEIAEATVLAVPAGEGPDVPGVGLDEESYARLSGFFTEAQFSALLWNAVLISAYNRMTLFSGRE
ncbi:carboxymuconolactone decarboxylase family protein [Sediminivirga luteola]|uniref:carboxymuconolactone decarboxylase family protein n=1 Tax=Sediminivirga luteola TaxID=1774748 RepID=UPI001F5956FF|nr:carboxymuconolactone decarboxylase family protein [Sediminivirga luteola]MCI2265256.1 carboxymuconolactone decarboxylase family protein [Sediminivirga luteola]